MWSAPLPASVLCDPLLHSFLGDYPVAPTIPLDISNFTSIMSVRSRHPLAPGEKETKRMNAFAAAPCGMAGHLEH